MKITKDIEMTVAMDKLYQAIIRDVVDYGSTDIKIDMKICMDRIKSSLKSFALEAYNLGVENK